MTITTTDILPDNVRDNIYFKRKITNNWEWNFLIRINIGLSLSKNVTSNIQHFYCLDDAVIILTSYLEVFSIW